ncbi:phage head completion protein [Pacificimonas sp. ICDLI1SI03]
MRGEFAGALTERIAILKPAGQDAAGAALPFIEDALVWACVTPENTGVDVRGERLSAFPKWAIIMRSGVEIVTGDRLRWRGEMLRVMSVTEDPRRPDRVRISAERQR